MTSSTTASTFSIGGDLEVHRLGYGAMRITGQGIWGEPADRDEALRVLRRATELGVDFIDTADSYGPTVSEELIHEALHPYADGLTIATKAGLLRTGPEQWVPLGNPAYLRQQAELSLRRLGVERIDLFQLHRIDEAFPLEDQVGEFKKLQDEGKVRHIGLSEVSVEQLRAAQAVAPIASVQNRFSLGDRGSQELLDVCTEEGIAFIPWRPVADHVDGAEALKEIAEAHDATRTQVALAWLLQLSAVIVPIPGTSSVAHLEENVAAAELTLTDDEMARLGEL
ncbi:aldo/keto reductase [Nocardioides flavescens]|uniref:Oxidoreductase n=1 Tax=Nocardioides flavescens TaxID=2691959 RepID=A0A6L7F1M0_9ACTN|nr:aldo/keto reductase [Nocardioides flavescens]MXG90402.1 oxidoreductase [Nocardioides flavescens]